MTLLLGIELSGSTVTLSQVNRHGQLTAEMSEPLSRPVSAWREAHPDEYHRSLLRVLARANQEGFLGAHIAGIGLAAEHGIVLLDREFRAIPLAAVPPGGSTLTELLASLANHAEPVHRRVQVVFSLLDYLRFRLSGALATHVGFALSSGLADRRAPTHWDPSRISEAGVSPHLLPPIFTAECLIGVVSAEVANVTGIPTGVRINAGSDPLAARMLASCEPSAEQRLVMVSGGAAASWRFHERAESEGVPLAAGIGWYSRESAAENGFEACVFDSAEPLRAEAVRPECRIAVDAGRTSAGPAIQAGLGLGWWRDRRVLWRKYRAPLTYSAWRSAEGA